MSAEATMSRNLDWLIAVPCKRRESRDLNARDPAKIITWPEKSRSASRFLVRSSSRRRPS